MRNLLPTALIGALCLCASISIQHVVAQDCNNNKLITNRSSSFLSLINCALLSKDIADLGIYNSCYSIDKQPQTTRIESVKI